MATVIEWEVPRDRQALCERSWAGVAVEHDCTGRHWPTVTADGPNGKTELGASALKLAADLVDIDSRMK